MSMKKAIRLDRLSVENTGPAIHGSGSRDEPVTFPRAGGTLDPFPERKSKRAIPKNRPFSGEYRSRTGDLLHAMQAL